jgi:hypothetical protein
MRNHDANGIAEHEDHDRREKNGCMAQIPVSERQGSTRRVARHERHEIAGQRQPGRIGHTGEKGDRAGERQARRRSARMNNASSSFSCHR